MGATPKKLSQKQLNAFRQMLLKRRQLLLGDVNHMQDNALRNSAAGGSGNLSTVPYHMADVGTDNFDHEFTLGLIENEEEELRQIDEALERIKGGSFGTCESCDKAIPKGRLKVIPYARLCIACKRNEEGTQ